MRLRSAAKPQFLFKPGRALARVFRAQHDRHRAVDVMLPWGVPIRVDTGETIGRSIWRTGVHDLPVLEAVWRLLDPGDTAVDVGANIGYVTSAMAARVGPEGRVIAFEPHPAMYQALVANIARFQRAAPMAAIAAHQTAVGDADGQGFLECPRNFDANTGVSRLIDGTAAAAPDATCVTVPVRRLDDFVDGDARIALLKIDVEGRELAALRGAERALGGGRIAHIVYEDLTGRDGAVHACLRRFGYRLFALGWQTHKPVLTTVDQGPRIDPAWESPNYLATRTPDEAAARFRRWGWSVI